MSMDTLIPTIAHAVRHPIHRDHELSLYIERPKAEKAVGFFGGVLIDLVDRAEHARVVQELSSQRTQLIDALDRLASHGHLQESTCATDEVNADLVFAAGVLASVKQPQEQRQGQHGRSGTITGLLSALKLLREHQRSLEDSNRDPSTGRVHDVDALEFIQQHDEACDGIKEAIALLQMERSQHDTDSRELCSLRKERDAARRQRDNWKFAHDGWQLAAEYVQGLSNTGVLPAQMLGMHCGDALVAFAEQMRRERDELAAWKASVEQAEPVAWLYHDARTAHEAHPWLHSTMVVLNADRRQGLRGETPLYTRPSPAASPERAEKSAEWVARFEAGGPDDADNWCDIPPLGWRCTRPAGHEGPCAAVATPEDIEFVERGMQRLRESAAAPAQSQPCRCGPDGCSDSVACPKGGAA